MFDILQKIVTEKRKTGDLVGAGLGIIRNDEPAVMAVDGFRKQGENEAVTVDDKWHMGSIGKSMTATMIARLVEAGHLAFGDRLGDVLSGYSMHEDWKRVSLEQLLTHRAGVVRDFPEASYELQTRHNDFDAVHQDRRHWVSALISEKPEYHPGSIFQYSNAGYTVAAYAASAVAGKSWEQLMIDEVFKPLQMNSGGFGSPSGDQPWGHRYNEDEDILLPENPAEVASDNPAFIGPAGTIHMSMCDLLSFGYEHLKGRKGESELLSAYTFSRLHSPPDTKEDYGYGWVCRSLNRQRVFWHNGSNGRWYSLIILLPEQDSVVSFVTNVVKESTSQIADKAFLTVYDRIIKVGIFREIFGALRFA